MRASARFPTVTRLGGTAVVRRVGADGFISRSYAPNDRDTRTSYAPGPVAEFLSNAWIAELDCAARASSDLTTAPDAQPVVVEQHVERADGTVTIYHLVFAADGARVQQGPAQVADLVLRTDEETARQLARGTLNAQQAAVAGRLKVRGHAERLRDAAELLRAANDVFRAVREATTDRASPPGETTTRR
jgi:hypothetical protein